MSFVLELKLKPLPSADIAECCAKAEDLAAQLGVAVEFEHNGVTVNVYHAQDGAAANQRWHREMAKRGYRSA